MQRPAWASIPSPGPATSSLTWARTSAWPSPSWLASSPIPHSVLFPASPLAQLSRPRRQEKTPCAQIDPVQEYENDDEDNTPAKALSSCLHAWLSPTRCRYVILMDRPLYWLFRARLARRTHRPARQGYGPKWRFPALWPQALKALDAFSGADEGRRTWHTLRPGWGARPCAYGFQT